MKNKQLFNKTIDVLVKAYQKGVLEYSECKACAVGNLVAAANGITILKDSFDEIYCENGDSGVWIDLIRPGSGLVDDAGLKNYKAVEQLLSTGYTFLECALIEKAFFEGTYLKNKKDDPTDDERNFEGLMSVVDCLMLIHEANESEVLEAKQLFVKETV